MRLVAQWKKNATTSFQYIVFKHLEPFSKFQTIIKILVKYRKYINFNRETDVFRLSFNFLSAAFYSHRATLFYSSVFCWKKYGDNMRLSSIPCGGEGSIVGLRVTEQLAKRAECHILRERDEIRDESHFMTQTLWTLPFVGLFGRSTDFCNFTWWIETSFFALHFASWETVVDT